MWDPLPAVCRPSVHPLLATKQSWINSTRPPRGEGEGAPSPFRSANRGSAFFSFAIPSPSANRSPLHRFGGWALPSPFPPHNHASYKLNPTGAGWGGRGHEHGARGSSVFLSSPPGARERSPPPIWRGPRRNCRRSRKSSPLERLGKVSRKGSALEEGRATNGEKKKRRLVFGRAVS